MPAKLEQIMERINIRINSDERKLLQRQAKREKRTVSQLVRKIIYLYLESKK